MSRVVAAVVIIVIIVIAAVGALYFATLRPTGVNTTTNTNSISATTTTTSIGSSTSTSNSFSSSTSLVVEEGTQPDSVDPAVEFTTPGNEVTSNVYQGLVAPNGQSTTSYVGEPASNWTASPNQMTWDFNLRHGVHFSNGDIFNAYVMWYSLYRTLVMNQSPSFILGQNFATSNGAGINITDAILNSINYTSPSQQNLTLMESPNQSFQVINQYEIVLQWVRDEWKPELFCSARNDLQPLRFRGRS